MGRADDPYRLGWRFWSRHLLVGACAAVAMRILSFFLDEPITWPGFVGTFLLVELLYLGPALSRHYHSSPEQLKGRWRP